MRHRLSRFLIIIALMTPTINSASAKNFDENEWESLGTGWFTDDIMTSYSVSQHIETWECEIMQSKTNPGVYRVVNPWYNGKCPYDIVKDKKFDTHEYDIIIHAENPDKVFCEDAKSPGLFDGKSLDYMSNGWSGVKYFNKDIDEMYDSFGHDLFGTFKDGIISFPYNSIMFVDKVSESSVTGYGANLSAATRIVLPGNVKKDFTIRITTDGDYLTGEPEVQFSMEVGRDLQEQASRIVWFIPLWLHSADMNTYWAYADYLDGTEKDYNPDQKLYTAKLPTVDFIPDGYWEGWYTIVGMALDEEGKPIAGAARPFYYYPPDAEENWTDVGMCTLNDNFINEVFSFISPSEHKAMMQRNLSDPGLYRVVNPFGGMSGNFHSSGHEHYLHIDARDPEKVMIQESVLGLDLGFGSMILKNMAYILLTEADGVIPEDSDYGKLVDGVILFPDNNLGFYSEKGYIVHWPELGFTIRMPKDLTSVAGNEVDDEKVYYFDILGRAVTTPREGQIYLRKKGSKVTKIVVS